MITGRSEQNHRHNLRAFIILVAVVIVGGLILWSQGDLINPLEGTLMLIDTSSGRGAIAEETENSPVGAAASAPERAAVAEPVSEPTADHAVVTTGTMTLEALTAELATAGVDVEAVSATMKAQGRSLESLLSVVNSGRVTVAELATRLKVESAGDSQAPAAEDSSELQDIQWDEFGSVVYNLWFILAVTAAIIVIARPAGWLVKQIKRRSRHPVVKPHT